MAKKNEKCILAERIVEVREVRCFRDKVSFPRTNLKVTNNIVIFRFKLQCKKFDVFQCEKLYRLHYTRFSFHYFQTYIQNVVWCEYVNIVL